MELYDRSAWTGNDKISGNAPHAHKEVNSHFVHPWNAARQGKDRRGQIANRRSTVGGRWNEKNRPRRLFSCAPLVQGQPLSRLTPPAFLNSAWSHHCARELACGTPCFIGLTSRCFAHRARASCAPPEHAAGDDFNARELRFHNSAWSFRIARKLACGSPCLIGLTPRCFAHWARASCAPLALSWGFLTV